MDRKDFLKSCMGLCALSLVPAGVIESCTKSSSTAPTNVNFTLDLSSSANAALNTVGGYMVTNGVIVIKYNATTFEAYSAACTHEGQQVVYQSGSSQIYCPRHGATFNPASGAVTGGLASSSLTKYTVTQSGNILTVKS
jgi:cytochrome b6-f complex iron-sulfur subunit